MLYGRSKMLRFLIIHVRGGNSFLFNGLLDLVVSPTRDAARGDPGPLPVLTLAQLNLKTDIHRAYRLRQISDRNDAGASLSIFANVLQSHVAGNLGRHRFTKPARVVNLILHLVSGNITQNQHGRAGFNCRFNFIVAGNFSSHAMNMAGLLYRVFYRRTESAGNRGVVALYSYAVVDTIAAVHASA